MLPLKIVSLWTISFLQVTLCLYPTALSALANIQTQRAKALANALALHNRAQYNVALARSRANLAQLPRISRQTGGFFPGGNQDTSRPIENQIWFEDDTETPKGNPEFNNMDNLIIDERLGAASPDAYQENQEDQQFVVIPSSGCSFQYASAPEEETTNISVHPNEDGTYPKIDIRHSDDITVKKSPNSNINKNVCPVCKQEINNVNKQNNGNGEENICPVCGNLINAHGSPYGARQADFNNMEVEDRELPPLDSTSFTGPPENVLIQDDVVNEDVPNFHDERLASPDPHLHGLHKHGFVHTHAHLHEHQSSFSIPQTSVVSPPVSLLPSTNIINVNNNQQTVVDPGLHSGSFGKPISTFGHGNQHLYESSNFGANSHSGLGVETQGFGINTHGIAQSTVANQDQFVEINSKPMLSPVHGSNINQQQSAVVNSGQATINQNQFVHTGRSSEPPMAEELVGEPNLPDEHLSDDTQDKSNDKDEMVSTFLLPSIHIDPLAEYQPNYYPPSYFNPTKPQDRQPMVKYIENEQKSIQKLLRFLSRKGKYQRPAQPSMKPTVYNYVYTYPQEKNKPSTQANDSQENSNNYTPRPLPIYVLSNDESSDQNQNQNENNGDSNNSYIYNSGPPENNQEAGEEDNQQANEEDNQGANEEGNDEADQENDQEDSEDSMNENYNQQYRKSGRSFMRSNKMGRNDELVRSSLDNHDFQFPQPLPVIPGMTPIPMSLPDLPRASDGLDPDTEQKLFSNFFKTEQRSVNNAIQEIQTEHQKNLNNLMRYLSDNTQENFNGNWLNSQQLQSIPEDNDRVGEPLPENMDFLMRTEAEKPSNEKMINEDMGQFEEDPTLQYIFQVPKRYDYYKRQTRSISTDDLDNLLLKEKEIVEKLKKYAKHDKDLMLIGYLGDNWINELQQKINVRKNRVKRQSNGKNNLAWNRLLSDPKLRLDISKTLDNIGTATRTALDYEKMPMYHVKNMVGSAKDAMVAAMKIPNQQFIIPSTYEIIPNDLHPDETVGAINPAILSEGNSEIDQSNKRSQADSFGVAFQKVGTVVRNSVKSGQEALSHVGSVANHAKKALHSARYMTPRVILKKMPTLAKEPLRQAMIITPRIFDFVEGNNEQVGSPLEEGITAGNIMDAVGISNPNSNMELEKIVMQPANSVVLRQRNNFDEFDDPLRNIKVERLGNVNDDIVGDILNSLHEAQMSWGVTSLKDLIKKIKRNVQSVLKSNILGTNRKNMHHGRVVPIRNNQEKHTKQIVQTSTESPTKTASETNKTQDEKVGVSLIPSGTILHPFMGRVSEEEIQDMLKEYKLAKSKLPNGIHKNHKDSSPDPVLGAINPLMYERVFNESIQLKPNEDIHVYPEKQNIEESQQTLQHNSETDHTNETKPEEDNEQVANMMEVKGPLLKPFMGKKHDPLNKYEKPEYEKPQNDNQEYIEFEPVNEENSSYEASTNQYQRRK